jgi:hypothetical protein
LANRILGALGPSRIPGVGRWLTKHCILQLAFQLQTARLLALMSLFDRETIPASLLHDQYGEGQRFGGIVFVHFQLASYILFCGFIVW